MLTHEDGALSAVAIAVGLGGAQENKPLQAWGTTLGLGPSQLYEQIAALGNLSASMLSDVMRCPDFTDDGFPGVYAYEVDEKLGALVGQLLLSNQGYKSIDCPAVRRVLGSLALRYFEQVGKDIPSARKLVTQWVESNEVVVGPAAHAVAICDGMGLCIVPEDTAFEEWRGDSGYGLFEMYVDIGRLGRISCGLREQIALQLPRDRFAAVDTYHREVDFKLGAWIAEALRARPSIEAIDHRHMRDELAGLATAYVVGGERQALHLRELVPNLTGRVAGADR